MSAVRQDYWKSFDMQNKHRVLLCCNTSFGLANFRAGLIASLQAHGYHVIAVAPRDDRTDSLLALGVEYHEWKLSARSANPLSELKALRHLRAIYRHTRPDLCLHYTVKPVIYGAMVCSLSGVRFASIITGLGYAFLNDGWVPRLIRWFYARLLSRSARTWFLNQDDLDLFLREQLVGPERAEIIPGEGIDTDHFALPVRASRRDTPLRFLMVSRLLFDKGVGEFAQACRLLRQRGVAFEATLAGGEGSENPSAIPKAQIESWEAEGLFRYIGTVADVRPLLADSDCVVLPSYREGLPRALLEASSMGLPIVATDVAGCRDVVLPGVSGLLCEPRNASALAEAMTSLSQLDNAQRSNMGLAGREFVRQRFEVRAVNRVYLDFIQATL